jgi:hypothetical protein
MKNRKLLALNLGLFALVVVSAFELRREIKQADGRYEILRPATEPKEVPDFPEPSPPPQVRPGDFMPVVERTLLSEDRNPVVKVIVPPVKPPPPRPPLPKLVGLMELSAGPIALMAAEADAPAGPIEVGESVGEFVFRGTKGERILLEWNGEQIEAEPNEMNGAPGKEKPRGRERARKRAPTPPVRAASTPRPRDPDALGGKYNIGKEIRPGVYRADPKDDAPNGTKFKGLVKRSRRTPFGTNAWWEKEKK